MAQQKGILPLKGTLGNITFYKSKDGYLAREKGGVDAKRIANDPAFQRTRENGVEFGSAGRAGKILRNTIRPLLQNASDSKMVSRLTKEMMRVIQADVTNDRGQRNVIDGEANLLEGFDFNVLGKLSATIYFPFTANIDRPSGLLTVSIPSFIPGNVVNAPAGSTHFLLNCAGLELDFEANNHVTDLKTSGMLPWNNVATALINLPCQVTAASAHPLFLLLGVEFYQFINGSMYPLKNGAFNALSIIKVSGQ